MTDYTTPLTEDNPSSKEIHKRLDILDVDISNLIDNTNLKRIQTDRDNDVKEEEHDDEKN